MFLYPHINYYRYKGVTFQVCIRSVAAELATGLFKDIPLLIQEAYLVLKPQGGESQVFKA